MVKRTITAALWLMLLGGAAFAQRPCTDQDAAQHPGAWNGRNKFGDDFANADRTLPKTQYPLLLSKADQVIDMIKALPTPTGAEAQPIRSISGNSYVKDGPVPFGVTVPIFAYNCIPLTSGNPDWRGKIQLEGETGTWIYFYFNSVGRLANERMVRGHT